MAGIEDFSLNNKQRGFVGVALAELSEASAGTPRPQPSSRPNGRKNSLLDVANYVTVLRWEAREARKEATLTQIQMAQEGDSSALIELMRKTELRERRLASHAESPDARNAALQRADTALGIRRHVIKGIS